MERQAVESSVIGAVGHTRVLEIEFETGPVYQYFNVPEEVYTGLLESESKGKYFNANIRGKYPFRELCVQESKHYREAAKSGS